MKTRILIITICFFCINLCLSQNHFISKQDTLMNAKKCNDREYQIVVYDFAKGIFDKSMVKPCYKVPTILRITNINPFFYNIKIKADDKLIDYLNTELSEQATTNIEKSEYIKLPEEKNYALTADVSTLLPHIKISDTNKSKQNYKNKITAYESLNNKLHIEKERFYKENDSQLKKILLDSISIIEKNIQKKDGELKEIEKKDSTHETLIQGIRTRAYNLNSSYFALLENVKVIIKLNGNFNNYIDKVIHPSMTFEEYQKIVDINKKNEIKKNIEGVFLLEEKNMVYAYSIINFYRVNSSSYLQKLNDFIYYINDSDISEIQNGDYILKQLNNEAEKAKKQLKDFDALVDEINLAKKFNHVEIINRLMQDKEFFQYSSIPIQGVEDYLEFNVNVESRKNISTDYYPDNKKNFRYFEYLKGGIRLDFSAGVVINFGTIDKHYSIQNDSIKLNSNNQFVPDLGVFFHSSIRNSRSFAPGIALGTSLDISKFNINSFYLGGSLLIGKRNKAIITAGPAFRLTQQLKANFNENTRVVEVKDVNDIVTKNFRIGFFFALTYNLTNKQKGLIKIPEQ